VEHNAPDRLRQVALDKILKAQEVVSVLGLPIGRLGLDGPGGDLVVVSGLRPGGGGGNVVKPRELAQLGPETSGSTARAREDRIPGM